MTDTDTRLDRLESQLEQQDQRLARQQETIERQREQIEQQSEQIQRQNERLEQQAATIETLRSDSSNGSGGASISRRGAMKAAGLVGLLGAGAGAATAGPTIGEPGNQVETLYAQGLSGDLTGGTAVTDLVGGGLAVNNGSLEPALSSDLTLSNGSLAVDVGPGDVGAAPDSHGNEAHSSTFATSGEVPSSPSDIGAASDSHGNEAHSSTFATSGEVPSSPGDIGAASDNHGNGAHSTTFVSSLSGGAGISQSSIGQGDTVSVAWGDASGLDASGAPNDFSNANDLDSNGNANIDVDVPADWGGGGSTNVSATADNSGVFSGENIQVEGNESLICGGRDNTITGGFFLFIGGGNNNQIGDGFTNTNNAAIVAGQFNQIINDGIPRPDNSIVCAGRENTIDGAARAFIGAGEDNLLTSDEGSIVTADGAEIAGAGAVVGGYGNRVDGPMAGVLNGSNNTAAGAYATVPGGANNTLEGDFSLAFGNNATVRTDGAVAFADDSDEEFSPDGPGLHAQMEAHVPEVNRVVSTPERDRTSIDGETALDSLAGVDVSTGEDGLVIDPEGFNEAFDLDGEGLGSLDVDAALLGAVQALAAEVERLTQDDTVGRTD